MIALRPDQTDDVVRARAALARHPRIVLQRPCATGKTVIACAISGAVTANGARTLILQHREELIAQTTRTLSEMGLAYGIIAAGQPHRDAPVQIASIATITRRLDAYQPGDFQLLLVDECHHAVAPTWRRVIDHFAGAYVVGLSASPLRLDGKGLDHLFGELVVGRSVKDYVGIGVLSPATTFAPPAAPDLRGIKKRAGDFDPEELARRMSNDTIVGDAVAHYRMLSPQLPGTAMTTPAPHTLTDRYTLWLNADGEAVQKPLSEMTGGEVLQAIKWHMGEARRLDEACEADRTLAEAIQAGSVAPPPDTDFLGMSERFRAAADADLKLADLLQRVHAGMPLWRRHPELKLTAAVQRFWPR